MLKLSNINKLSFVLCLILLHTNANENFARSSLVFEQKTSSVDLFVNLRKSIREVDEKFASVTIDSSLFADHWPAFNFRSVRLRTLARGLSPAYLRFGGTASDFLIFRKNGSKRSCYSCPHDYNNWTSDIDVERRNFSTFYMSASDFDDLNKFARDVGWRLVFDLNAMVRDSRSGSWNSSNARELLQYAVQQNYDDNIDLELGNEPNAYRLVFQREVTAEQLAADFQSLNMMLRSFVGRFNSSLLIGPSISQPKPRTIDFLARFLQSVRHSINVISVHHYYISGEHATLSNMTSPSVLGTLLRQLHELRQTIVAVGYSNVAVWLGETGSCWHGGAPQLSNTYVAGFMLLDKLGVAALMDISVVARQSFFHADYALVDNDVNPNPDYWLTWLYKQLVGPRVLVAQTSDSDHVRLYAHCTNSKFQSWRRGSVTVFGLNLHDRNISLKFDDNLAHPDKHVYWVVPHKHHKLTSRLVSVSGKTLRLADDDKTFPVISPVIVAGGHNVIIPRKSFGFIVIPDAKAAACMSDY